MCAGFFCSHLTYALSYFQISLKTLMMPMINDGRALPIELSFNINSSNPEANTSLGDNNVEMKIPVYVETDIIIRG